MSGYSSRLTVLSLLPINTNPCWTSCKGLPVSFVLCIDLEFCLLPCQVKVGDSLLTKDAAQKRVATFGGSVAQLSRLLADANSGQLGLTGENPLLAVLRWATSHA